MAKVSSEYTASNDVGVVAVEPGSCKHCGKWRQVFLIGALILDSAELAVFFGGRRAIISTASLSRKILEAKDFPDLQYTKKLLPLSRCQWYERGFRIFRRCGGL